MKPARFCISCSRPSCRACSRFPYARAHEKEKPKAEDAAAVVYVCPMHPDVTSTDAGQVPEVAA